VSELDEKYRYVCSAMTERYPVLASVWNSALDRFGSEWLVEFLRNLETVYGGIGEGVSPSLLDAMDGYAEFANDSMRNQVYFEKHGHYRATSYSEAVNDFYLNEEHMTRRYLPGMYLSHLLWPQHFHMLRSFKTVILPRFRSASLFFEVGVGCGMYSKVMLENLPQIRGVGLDISQYALDFTMEVLRRFGLSSRYRVAKHDISEGFDEACDVLICQEVLEHLEDPGLFCKWLFRLIRPGGHAYVTAALNAAHSDHIYLFHKPAEVESLLREVGFQPVHAEEEFAPGNKPRHITPSLAGFLCLRP
jgi:2-polyprenyl-3-methyl-5-hydroxy-6-metoxy-1,4-benzoquinol methylase